jgi:hypothetical protein
VIPSQDDALSQDITAKQVFSDQFAVVSNKNCHVRFCQHLEISRRDTDDTQSAVGDIRAILKACSVCHAQQPRDWSMAMLRKAFSFVLAGLLFVLAFFEVGVFCWPYKDLNEMLQPRKQCGSPDRVHR